MSQLINSQSVSESVSKVGIELLGQLKSDFDSGILDFGEYFSEFLGVFFRIFPSIFQNFSEYFSKFSVIFQIFPSIFPNFQYFSDFFPQI